MHRTSSALSILYFAESRGCEQWRLSEYEIDEAERNTKQDRTTCSWNAMHNRNGARTDIQRWRWSDYRGVYYTLARDLVDAMPSQRIMTCHCPQPGLIVSHCRWYMFLKNVILIYCPSFIFIGLLPIRSYRSPFYLIIIVWMKIYRFKNGALTRQRPETRNRYTSVAGADRAQKSFYDLERKLI